jgi:proteasome lid subunit RPN8/RPN11
VSANLDRRAHDDIVAHAREAAPAECCGLLIGAGESVIEAARTNNLASDPNRFEMDPGDHIRARREARTRGLDVLGFYHSHPRSPATPSTSDRAEAWYPDYLYLIVSVRAEQPEVRLYRLRTDGFAEVPWHLT